MSTAISPPASLSYSHQAPLPALSQMLGQGVITAIAFYYFAVLYAMMSEANGYIFWGFMPLIFGYAAVFGVVIAIVMWVVMKLAPGPLSWWVRITVATLVIMFVYRVLNLSLTWDGESRYAQFGKFALLFVVVVGLVTGSRLRPGRVLIRGLMPLTSQSRGATLIGFVFRTLTLYGWMESGFFFVLMMTHLNQIEDFRYFIIAVLILTYFSINACFGFGGRNSVLTVLALLVNSAFVFVLVRYRHDLTTDGSYFVIAYLSLWFLFLLTHLPNRNRVLTSLKDELRYYYLID